MKRFHFFLMTVLLAFSLMPKTSTATCGCAAGRVSPLFCVPTQATKATLGLLEATGVISSKDSYTSELTTMAMGVGMTLFGGVTANSALAYKGLAWAGNGAVTLVARSYEPHLDGLVFDLTYLLMAGTAYSIAGTAYSMAGMAYSFGGALEKGKDYLDAFALPSLVKVSGRTFGYLWDVLTQTPFSAPVEGRSRKAACGGEEEIFQNP